MVEGMQTNHSSRYMRAAKQIVVAASEVELEPRTNAKEVLHFRETQKKAAIDRGRSGAATTLCRVQHGAYIFHGVK